jgi:hypothetical protein
MRDAEGIMRDAEDIVRDAEGIVSSELKIDYNNIL